VHRDHTWIQFCLLRVRWYGDGVVNTVDEDFSVFCVFRMPNTLFAVSEGMWVVKFCFKKIPQFLTGDAGYHRFTCIMATKRVCVCVFFLFGVVVYRDVLEPAKSEFDRIQILYFRSVGYELIFGFVTRSVQLS